MTETGLDPLTGAPTGFIPARLSFTYAVGALFTFALALHEDARAGPRDPATGACTVARLSHK